MYIHVCSRISKPATLLMLLRMSSHHPYVRVCERECMREEREREKERERERESFTTFSTAMRRVCVYARERKSEREREKGREREKETEK